MKITTLNHQIIQHIPPRSKSNRLIVIQKAHGVVVCNHNKFELVNNSILFVNSLEHLDTSMVKGIDGYLIEFSTEEAHLYAPNRDVVFRLPFFSIGLTSSYRKYGAKAFQAINNLANLLFTDYCRVGKVNQLHFFAYLTIILIKAEEGRQKTNRKRIDYTNYEITNKFIQLVNSQLANFKYLKEYANELNLSVNHLITAVKIVTHKTPHDIITEKRIIEAKYLLLHSKLSPKEVGIEIGFNDQSYFTKFFKKNTGLSPLEWFVRNVVK